MKRILGLVLAFAMALVSLALPISVGAEGTGEKTITATHSVSGNVVTVSGSVSSGEKAYLNMRVTQKIGTAAAKDYATTIKQGDAVCEYGNFYTGEDGKFTVSFEIEESYKSDVVYNYIISEENRVSSSTDIIVENFDDGAVSNAYSNTGTFVTVPEGSSNKVYDMTGYRASGGYIQYLGYNATGTQDAHYSLEADVYVTLNNSGDLIFTSNSTSGVANREDINTVSNEAYKVKMKDGTLVLYCADNKTLQSSGQTLTLVENFTANEWHTIKVEFHGKALDLRVWVDGIERCAGTPKYIFAQKNYGRLFIADLGGYIEGLTYRLDNLDVKQITKTTLTGITSATGSVTVTKKVNAVSAVHTVEGDAVTVSGSVSSGEKAYLNMRVTQKIGTAAAKDYATVIKQNGVACEYGNFYTDDNGQFEVTFEIEDSTSSSIEYNYIISEENRVSSSTDIIVENFDDGAVSNAYSNTGTFVTVPEGSSNKVYDMTGYRASGGYIQYLGYNATGTQDAHYSLEADVYVTLNNSGNLILTSNSTSGAANREDINTVSNEAYKVMMKDGTLVLYCADNKTLQSSGQTLTLVENFTANEWHTIKVEFHGKALDLRVWVDGIERCAGTPKYIFAQKNYGRLFIADLGGYIEGLTYRLDNLDVKQITKTTLTGITSATGSFSVDKAPSDYHKEVIISSIVPQADGTTVISGRGIGKGTGHEIFVYDSEGKLAYTAIDEGTVGETNSFKFVLPNTLAAGDYQYVVTEDVDSEATFSYTTDFSTIPTAGKPWGTVNGISAETGSYAGKLKIASSGSEAAFDMYNYFNGNVYRRKGIEYITEVKMTLDAKPTADSVLWYANNTNNNMNAPFGPAYTQEEKAAFVNSTLNRLFEVRADENGKIYLRCQDNNKKQSSATYKEVVLVESLAVGQEYKLKFHVDIDTLAIKAYVDDVEKTTGNDNYIADQTYYGYNTAFRAVSATGVNAYYDDLKVDYFMRNATWGTVRIGEANEDIYLCSIDGHNAYVYSEETVTATPIFVTSCHGESIIEIGNTVELKPGVNKLATTLNQLDDLTNIGDRKLDVSIKVYLWNNLKEIVPLCKTSEYMLMNGTERNNLYFTRYELPKG